MKRREVLNYLFPESRYKSIRAKQVAQIDNALWKHMFKIIFWEYQCHTFAMEDIQQLPSEPTCSIRFGSIKWNPTSQNFICAKKQKSISTSLRSIDRYRGVSDQHRRLPKFIDGFRRAHATVGSPRVERQKSSQDKRRFFAASLISALDEFHGMEQVLVINRTWSHDPTDLAFVNNIC